MPYFPSFFRDDNNSDLPGEAEITAFRPESMPECDARSIGFDPVYTVCINREALWWRIEVRS
jgi:hypothetical protein